jgi:teichuronic acid biosynthesis glycosyltransferase TuaG
MKGALVSVMMPAYNTVAYIKWAIESMQAQTYESWELLILDDASTDGTFELASVIAKKDKRIKVSKNKRNMGVNRTRDALAKASQGYWLAHLDSDDMLERWALEEMVRAFAEQPEVRLIYSDFVQVGKKNQVESYSSSPDFDILKLHQHGWRHFGMYRRDVFEHIQGFNEKIAHIPTCEDGDLFMQIAEKFPIYRLPKVLYQYRNHGDHTSSKKPKCEECPANPDCNYIRVWAKSLNYDQRTFKPLEEKNET